MVNMYHFHTFEDTLDEAELQILLFCSFLVNAATVYFIFCHIWRDCLVLSGRGILACSVSSVAAALLSEEYLN